MNVDDLVRDALHEEAADSMPAPSYLADRVLAVRRRSRTRRLASLAATTAVAVAVAVAVPLLGRGGHEARPASEMNASDIIGHPDQSPPKDLIAAGDTVLSAFYVHRNVKQSNGDIVHQRVYGLLDQNTGRYEKAEWAYLDVAPGSRTAAVLEGELPAKRIGLLDLITGKVDRWIALDRGVAGVSFSPDGTKLVATTYAKNPDRGFADHKERVNGKEIPGPVPSRTGFTVVDVESGKAVWHEAPFQTDEMGLPGNSREDFDWSHDGTLVYADTPVKPFRQYYSLNGDRADWPSDEKVAVSVQAGVSPDGKLAAGDFAGRGTTIAAAVLDPHTGKQITTVPVQQLLAWADNKRLIGWGCEPKRCSGKGEFRNQLLLVTIGTDKVVPLSGFRGASADYPGRWTPVFSSR
ncbi:MULTISPECIES: WD40 repeat domain-containing protein [unclassified Streptomyces]|uniref:WD40 repeat domain-containing protein n=1 Tax=unclassified Streptomyces TaxID=2593676 RepID=UPI002259B4F9|nr:MULTISPECIES: WD40 repeat domain-containing protein [unclassified Streptomyces]MCX4991757.1 WD40 repeat domain-containing protein [Streptomyces sp. NBC_00568]MCX5003007.1 WD40 repeat domain-containing protein [Streptomyces sp. NBC_00638]